MHDDIDQVARLNIARNNRRLPQIAPAQQADASVQSKIRLLLILAMAVRTVLLKDCPNVPREVDFVRERGKTGSRDAQDGDAQGKDQWCEKTHV